MALFNLPRPVRFENNKESFLSCIAVLFVLIFSTGGWADEKPLPEILILNSYHQGEDWTDNELSGISSVINGQYPYLGPSIENLDTKRFPDPEYLQVIKQYLKNKYQGRHFDLIFTLDNSALSLMTTYRQELFPGVPIVFAGINGYTPDLLKDQDRIAGVAEEQDMAGTLNLALNLHPQTKTVMVIHDYTSSGLALRKEMSTITDQFKSRVSIHYNRNETVDDLLAELRLLPEDSLVLLLTYVTDKEGRTLTREESTRLISDSSPVPVYAMHETRLGYGIVGGMLLEGKEHGRQAAEIALKILSTRGAAGYVVEKSRSRPVFDYRQLVRFKIDQNKLPSNSILINQPVSFFQQHRALLLPGSIVAALLVTIIFILVIAVARIRNAKNEVKKSDAKYRGLFASMVDGLILADPETRNFIEVNPASCEMTGYTPEELTSMGVKDIHPAESLPYVFEQFNKQIKGEINIAQSLPVKRKDGSIFFADVNAVPTQVSGKTLFLGIFRDITERKKAEELLQESEERHRKYILNAPYGVLAVDAEGYFQQVNPAACRLSGYSEQELLAMRIIDLLDSDSLKTGMRHFQQLVQEGKSQADLLHRQKNGEVRWWSVIAIKISDNLFLGFCEDITDRKLADEHLRESEEKFRSLAESSPDYIVRYDQNCRHIYLNKAALDAAGLTETDIIGKTHSESGFPEDMSTFWENKIARVFETGKPYQTEFSWETAQGLMVLDWRLTPEFGIDGRVSSVLGVSRDVTERKRGEQALMFEKLMLARTESIAHIGSWEWEISTDTVTWSDELFRIFQRDPKEGAPSFAEHPVLFHADDMVLLQKAVEAAIANGTPYILELRAFRSDGEIRNCIAHGFVETAKDGKAIRLYGSLQDITERRQEEELRKRLESQLQQAQKMEAIGTLAGGIAHDFNNILGAILGYAEMVQEECPTGTMMRSDVDRIVEASYRAKDLIKQILAFSRQTEADVQALQPDLIIKEAIKMLRASLPATIEIQQNIDPEAGLILADPIQIHQIITNLCTNAFHAMEETGGTLNISLQNKELTLADLGSEPKVQPGHFIEISVGDTGPGIAPELMDKIFDPFFTTKEVGKGTGMGLAIIHGIAKKSGGFVSCNSSPGKGTTFNVYLPVHPDTARAKAEASPVELIQTGIERILFIDDEEMLAQMGKTMLERLGYRVTVETNSIEALKIMQSQPDRFDLVITDQTMPGMTGSDLARRMLQIRPGLPIILCTGFSNQISEEKARIYGIKGFAMKPLAKKDLATLIRRVLDGEKQEK